MKTLRWLTTIRSISISQKPVISSNTIDASSKGIVSSKAINNQPINIAEGEEQLTENDVIDSPSLHPLGSPSNLVKVKIPPSIPMYMKRGSLVSIFDIGNLKVSSIKNLIEFINPLKNLMYGNFNIMYQKLISTSKFSALVSSSQRGWFNISKVTDNKTLSVINIDGTNDWALLNKKLLQLFLGDSLRVTNYLLPRTVSRKFLKSIAATTGEKVSSTGLRSWNQFSYSLLTGRGHVGIVGQGSIYNISLVDNEEILINKKNLLAMTVNGPPGLQNCVVGLTSEASKAPSPSFSNFNAFVSHYLSKAYNYFKDDQGFVKVLGPRDLLIQSDSSFKVLEVPRESIKENVNDFTKKSKDYLNYVNLGDKNQVQSTKDFKKSIDQTYNK